MIDKFEHQEYRVLARKYRPQKFKDLIGQDMLVNTLSNSITNNRIAHAYLLTGVRGVGKTTTARLIAMSINCKDRIVDSCEPCEKCNSCDSIRADHNLDVIEIDAASKTGVDDIRQIIDNVKYKPVNSLYKIFIIDEIHMLSKNAFNALLKTLEEPPAHVKFIFATTEVKKIPITIISRCQRFDLHRIGKEDLTNHLNLISKKENIDIDLSAMALIVRSADGSMRDGLSLLDQAIAGNNKKITSELITKMLGLADKAAVFELLDAVFKGNAASALNIFNKIYNAGADVTMIFDELLNITHFITQIKIATELKDDIQIPEIERLKGYEMSQKLSMASIGMTWQVLFKGYEELQSGYHMFQHGEMIIIRLIYLQNGSSPDDLIKKNKEENFDTKSIKIKESESKQNTNPSVILNANSNLKKENQSIQISNNQNNILKISSFRHFVDLFYKNREGMIHAYLYNNARLISFKEGEIVLNIKSINDQSFPRTIAKLISKWTGRIWQISSSSSNIGQTLYELDLIKQQKEIEDMKTDPLIKSILNEYEGVKIYSITDIAETEIEKDNHLKNEINK